MFSKETHSNLLTWLLSNKEFGYSFYGANRLTMAISQTGGMQLSIAKPLDENRKFGKVDKGVNIYNNNKDEMIFFTLAPTECIKVGKHLLSVLDGTYVDPDVRCPENYKGVLKIVHFSQDKKTASKLYFAKVQYQNRDKQTITGVTLTVNPAAGGSAAFFLNNENLELFHHFADNCGKFNVYYMQLMQAFLKQTLSKLYTTVSNYDQLKTDSEKYKNKTAEVAQEVEDIGSSEETMGTDTFTTTSDDIDLSNYTESSPEEPENEPEVPVAKVVEKPIKKKSVSTISSEQLFG